MQKISQVLRSKAEQARQKVAYKATMDSDCNNYERTRDDYPEYTFASFEDFLQSYGYIESSLDKKPRARKVTMPLKEVMKNNYMYADERHEKYSIGKNWFHKQNAYIRSLDTESVFNVFGYTHYGDRFVNTYLRGTFDTTKFKTYLKSLLHQDDSDQYYFPLFFPALRMLEKIGRDDIMDIFDTRNVQPRVVEQTMSLVDTSRANSSKYWIMLEVAKYFSYDRFWALTLQHYIDCLQKIIANAPATTQPMMLYRGVENDYYLSKFMLNHRDRIHVANGFVSTSSAISIASKFTDKPSYGRSMSKAYCCFMRVFVPKGTKMLFISGLSSHSVECEFLLGHDTQVYITNSKTESFCKGKDKVDMRVSDVVVIK